MDMIQHGSSKRQKSTPKRGKQRVASSEKKRQGLECRDILSPNTQHLLSTTSTTTNKIFSDSIYAHITLEPVCFKIVDTPQFQRLHGLKQLGTCDFVFRAATHTRFEHSIGVSHLSARMVNTIKTNQPELGISENDVMCVKIAGLCHDLGHGPFSHVFDGVFIKSMYPNGLDGNGKSWRHEDGSVEMFRYLLSDNSIDLVGDYGFDPIDVTFIEEIIRGTDESDRKGREESKFFLYDVVNNARSGLDMDKLDYFQRDLSRTHISTGTSSREFDRFIDLAYVMRAEPINGNSKENLPLMICYPEKMVREAVSLFATRFNMHQQVYTHKSVKQVEFMITDALKLADPYIRIHGNVTKKFPKGEYKMSETIFDMKAFMSMKDSILDIICHSAASIPELKPAEQLISRLFKRKLYRYIGTTSSLSNGGESVVNKTENEILDEILAINARSSEEDASFSLDGDDSTNCGIFGNHSDSLLSRNGYVHLTRNDLIVEKMHIHYGMKSKNPVDRLRFFPKHANLPGQSNVFAKRVDECVYETVLPRVFEDRAIRLFCRDPEKAEAARLIFERWCEEANAQMPFPSLSQAENSQPSLLEEISHSANF